jgi:hypothetical protein
MRSFLRGLLLFWILIPQPTHANDPSEWFQRQLNSQFAPLYERCGQDMCRRLTFEDMIVWQDEQHSDSTFWSVTVVMLNTSLAQRFTFHLSPDHSLHLVHQGEPFHWLQ